MLQDVDERSEGVADIEPAHPPRLGRRTVFDRDVRLSDSRQGFFEVIHFDGQIGTAVPDPPSDITLIWIVALESEP